MRLGRLLSAAALPPRRLMLEKTDPDADCSNGVCQSATLAIRVAALFSS
jgi:hypothetical protein